MNLHKKEAVMRNTIVTTVILMFCFGCQNSRDISSYQEKFSPKDGFVPDSKTAIDVAKVILPNIYGKDVLKEKPFTCKLIGDTVWIVEGSLPKGWDGGVAHIEIRKSDCKILNVIHGK